MYNGNELNANKIIEESNKNNNANSNNQANKN
jgi:hypothetical protein